MRYNDNTKKKFRAGAAVSLEEIEEDINKRKELVTELSMIDGYIGFIDDKEIGLRIYIFKTDDAANNLVREAKRLKYRTAGRVADCIHVANSECERPHLQYMPRARFYSELYK